jgi:hypothetical protein
MESTPADCSALCFSFLLAAGLAGKLSGSTPPIMRLFFTAQFGADFPPVAWEKTSLHDASTEFGFCLNCSNSSSMKIAFEPKRYAVFCGNDILNLGLFIPIRRVEITDENQFSSKTNKKGHKKCPLKLFF